MASLTDEQKTEYKEHIFLANSLFNEAKIAIREGCTHIAKTKLESAMAHYKSAGQIVAGKSVVGTNEALAGIKKCGDLIAAIVEESREK